MLLHELPEAQGSLHELPDTSDDKRGVPFDKEDVGPGDRLLLDLSEAEESRYLAVQNALPDFRAAVVARGAHLAVVLPHHLGYLLRGDLRFLTTDIGRPIPRRVLAVHLRCSGVRCSDEDLRDTGLTTYLTRSAMNGIAALADRIKRLQSTSPADRGFPHWLAESLEEQRDQTKRVAADIAAAQSGRQRALLLSLAMFHEASPQVVLRATNSLLGVLSHPPDPSPRLDRADLHAELETVQAETGPDGRVRFRLIGYDVAVRNHFWTFLPDIRHQLRNWLRDRIADQAVAPSVRTAAVTRFAEQTLRAGAPDDLAWLSEQWTATGATYHLIREAAQALALGLDHDHHGRFFRQRIYDWATSTETSARLQRVLIMVCSQTMARSHPDQALVRLHHLARRCPDPVAAYRAVTDLARSDDRLYMLMLDRLAAGVERPHGEADLDLFRELADPMRLAGDHRVQTSLVTGWTGLLRHPRRDWTADVRQWLTAGEDTQHREPLLRVLADASASDTQIAGRVFRVALDWKRAEPTEDRADVVSRLLMKINTAQGIEPYGTAA
ncbi:hypothetical protein AB0E08_12270 [Streptomyces sp. NPDC048281]|uniref:hypothetical protein n=1 Tax=Streptomyces sp. NPDC048281 TaxID=3154715 RepID=UPI003448DFD3